MSPILSLEIFSVYFESLYLMNEYVNNITLRSSLDQGDRFGLITSPRREDWAHHFTKKRGLGS
jgi:hypothetical protein